MDTTSPIVRSAMEALRYQRRPQLYQSLVSTFKDALDGDLLAVQRAGDVIKHATNMPITAVTYPAPRPNAFIQFTAFDVNNILRSPGLRSLEGEKVSMSAFAKALEEERASVNSDGSVNGVFTKFPSTISIASCMLNGSFTAEELAAIVLHEVGHQYNYFDMLGRSLLASVAIAQLEELLQGIENLETRSHYIESTAKVLTLKNIDADELARKEDENNLRYVLVREVIAKLVTDAGDERAFNGESEFLADSYAVRMGAAAPLVSGFVKVAKQLGDRSFLNKKAFLATEATKVMLTLLMAGSAALMFAQPTFVVGTVVAALLLSVTAQDITERNTAAERLEAIHHQLIAVLKDRSLPKEAQSALLKDAEYISTLRETVKDRFTIMGAILYTLSPLARRTYKQIKLQQELSRLIHNDLFIKAAQLKQLSGSTTASRTQHGS